MRFQFQPLQSDLVEDASVLALALNSHPTSLATASVPFGPPPSVSLVSSATFASTYASLPTVLSSVARPPPTDMVPVSTSVLAVDAPSAVFLDVHLSPSSMSARSSRAPAMSPSRSSSLPLSVGSSANAAGTVNVDVAPLEAWYSTAWENSAVAPPPAAFLKTRPVSGASPASATAAEVDGDKYRSLVYRDILREKLSAMAFTECVLAVRAMSPALGVMLERVLNGWVQVMVARQERRILEYAKAFERQFEQRAAELQAVFEEHKRELASRTLTAEIDRDVEKKISVARQVRIGDLYASVAATSIQTSKAQGLLMHEREKSENRQALLQLDVDTASSRIKVLEDSVSQLKERVAGLEDARSHLSTRLVRWRRTVQAFLRSDVGLHGSIKRSMHAKGTHTLPSPIPPALTPTHVNNLAARGVVNDLAAMALTSPATGTGTGTDAGKVGEHDHGIISRDILAQTAASTGFSEAAVTSALSFSRPLDELYTLLRADWDEDANAGLGTGMHCKSTATQTPNEWLAASATSTSTAITSDRALLGPSTSTSMLHHQPQQQQQPHTARSWSEHQLQANRGRGDESATVSSWSGLPRLGRTVVTRTASSRLATFSATSISNPHPSLSSFARTLPASSDQYTASAGGSAGGKGPRQVMVLPVAHTVPVGGIGVSNRTKAGVQTSIAEEGHALIAPPSLHQLIHGGSGGGVGRGGSSVVRGRMDRGAGACSPRHSDRAYLSSTEGRSVGYETGTAPAFGAAAAAAAAGGGLSGGPPRNLASRLVRAVLTIQSYWRGLVVRRRLRAQGIYSRSPAMMQAINLRASRPRVFAFNVPEPPPIPLWTVPKSSPSMSTSTLSTLGSSSDPAYDPHREARMELTATAVARERANLPPVPFLPSITYANHPSDAAVASAAAAANSSGDGQGQAESHARFQVGAPSAQAMYEAAWVADNAASLDATSPQSPSASRRLSPQHSAGAGAGASTVALRRCPLQVPRSPTWAAPVPLSMDALLQGDAAVVGRGATAAGGGGGGSSVVPRQAALKSLGAVVASYNSSGMHHNAYVNVISNGSGRNGNGNRDSGGDDDHVTPISYGSGHRLSSFFVLPYLPQGMAHLLSVTQVR